MASTKAARALEQPWMSPMAMRRPSVVGSLLLVLVPLPLRAWGPCGGEGIFRSPHLVPTSAIPFHQFPVLLLGDLVRQELVGEGVAADAGQFVLEPWRTQEHPVQPQVVLQVGQLDLPGDVVGLA